MSRQRLNDRSIGSGNPPRTLSLPFDWHRLHYKRLAKQSGCQALPEQERSAVPDVLLILLAQMGGVSSRACCPLSGRPVGRSKGQLPPVLVVILNVEEPHDEP